MRTATERKSQRIQAMEVVIAVLGAVLAGRMEKQPGRMADRKVAMAIG